MSTFWRLAHNFLIYKAKMVLPELPRRGGWGRGSPTPIFFPALVKNVDSSPNLVKKIWFKREKKQKSVIFGLILDINVQNLIKKWLKNDHLLIIIFFNTAQKMLSIGIGSISKSTALLYQTISKYYIKLALFNT